LLSGLLAVTHDSASVPTQRFTVRCPPVSFTAASLRQITSLHRMVGCRRGSTPRCEPDRDHGCDRPSAADRLDRFAAIKVHAAH
jgi:hypothetical protein